jgi:phospholipase A1
MNAARRARWAVGAVIALMVGAALVLSPRQALAARGVTRGIPAPGEPDLLTFYDRTYYATGFVSDTQVKFQFSLKYDLWPNRSEHTVYFAYTQKSLWDLWRFDESSPFVENNYAPELFYAHAHEQPLAGCGLADEQVGLIHESNGRGAVRSRGWNRLYGAMRAGCRDRADQRIEWRVRLWLPFGMKDNPDIAEYVGYGEALVTYGTPRTEGWQGQAELSAAFRKGVARRGSVRLEASWRPGYERLFRGVWRFTPYLFGQLFTGHAETLETYDRAQTSVRVGLGFRDKSSW